VRSSVLIAALAVSGCGNQGHDFDECARSGLISGQPIASDEWPFAMDVDDAGYVVFWGGEVVEPPSELTGVHAARPDGTSVDLLPDVNAAVVTALTIDGRHLVCWVSNVTPSAVPGGCMTVDADLQVTSPDAQTSYGFVSTLGRIGTQPYAFATRDPLGGPEGLLVPVDAAGGAAGASVPIPCPPWRSGRVAWGDTGFACLVPNDPRCGDQFDEPSGCQFDLHVYGPDGGELLSSPGVAPFGTWGQEVQPRLATNQGGFVVAWAEIDGHSYTRAIAADGTAGPPTEVAGVGPLFPLFSGYLLTWIEEASGGYQLPHAALLDTSGVVTTSAALAEPVGPQHERGRGLVMASSANGFGVAWVAESGESGVIMPVLEYRAMGCGGL
jgi:hypothetical protein